MALPLTFSPHTRHPRSQPNHTATLAEDDTHVHQEEKKQKLFKGPTEWKHNSVNIRFIRLSSVRFVFFLDDTVELQ